MLVAKLHVGIIRFRQIVFYVDCTPINVLHFCLGQIPCLCCSCVIVDQNVFFVGGGPFTCKVAC